MPPGPAASVRRARCAVAIREGTSSTDLSRRRGCNNFFVVPARRVPTGMASRVKSFWNFLLRPRTRYALAWLCVLVIAALTGLRAWTGFDSTLHPDGSPRRRGGNNGHAMIDFGGQWLMGRMLV